jgi:hypothetical protein
MPNGAAAMTPTQYVENVTAHAAVGCASALASGGKCGPSALAGGVTSAAGPVINGNGFFFGLVANAALGGGAAVLGGGKFENGAITGAFGYLFNNYLHPDQCPPGADGPLCGQLPGGARGGGYPGKAPALAPDAAAAESGSAADQLAINRAAGAAFEQSVGAELEQSGVSVGQQITVQTQSGVRTRLDFLAQDPQTGEIACIECKASQTAPLTQNQTLAFPEIRQTGGTIVGAGKPGFPGGTQIPPTAVQIIRGQ